VSYDIIRVNITIIEYCYAGTTVPEILEVLFRSSTRVATTTDDARWAVERLVSALRISPEGAAASLADSMRCVGDGRLDVLFESLTEWHCGKTTDMLTA
jgi:hypothetical protein